MADLEKTIKEVKVEIVELRKRVTILENPEAIIQTSLTSKVKKLSPREFLNRHTTSSDVERILLFGFFLEHYQDYDLFNIDDLKNLFYTAKVKPPININDKINMNIKKGHMVDNLEKKDKKKAWALTNKGEDYVDTIKKEIK